MISISNSPNVRRYARGFLSVGSVYGTIKLRDGIKPVDVLGSRAVRVLRYSGALYRRQIDPVGIAKNYDQPDATWEIAKLRKSDYYRNGELCSQGLSQMIVGRLVEHKDLVSEYGDSTESALAAIRCFMLGDTAGFNRNVHSLRNVDLDLSGAYLRGAMIDGMDLTSVSLIKANLTNAVLRGVSLRGTFLAGAKMAGAVLIGCDFAPETVDMAKMRNVTFVRSKVPSTPEFAAFANKYGIKIVD